MHRARGFRFGLWGVVAITLLPAMLFPITFFSSLAEFWSINVKLPPDAHRAVRVTDRLGYYMARKWSSLGTVLAHNTFAEHIPVEDFWRDDEVHIDIPSLHLDRLNADLPLSGEEYQKANLWNDGRYRRARLRYRGNSGWHWLFDKKSLKVRTSKRRLFHGQRGLNLTVKLPYVSSATHRLARAFELMAPHSAVVQVFVNNKFYGIERYMEEVDEGFLRREGRLPGDIYKGEGVAVTNEYHYGTKREFLLRSPYVWPKIAVDNSQPDEQRDALVAWSRAINNPAPQSLDELEAFLDLDTVARHLALNILMGEYHCKDGNNLKWYLDPTDGKFYPILWDVYSRSNAELFTQAAPLNRSIVNHATHKLLRDPRLMQRALVYLFGRLAEPGLIESIIDPLEAYGAEHAAAVAADQGNPQFPVGLDELQACRARLLANRTRALDFIAAGSLSYARTGDACVLGTDAPAGVLLEGLSLGGSGAGGRVELVLDRDRDGLAQADEPRLELARAEDGRYLLSDPLTLLPALDGPSRLIPRALAYVLLLPADVELLGLHARNAITGAAIETHELESWTQTPVDVRHPWDDLPPAPESWDWPGSEHEIEGDVIVPAHVTLRIAAGARLRIAPGASLFVSGKILVEGSAEAPVIFEPLEAGRPWGVLALQGAAASGSRFSNAVFREGSLARHERVRYPGMVSVHHATDVRFEHCLFEHNLIGDDALRAAHSVLDIEGCRFEHIASDGVDFDHSSGRIVGNQFHDTGNDGIDLMTSDPWIEGNVLDGCRDKGISIGEAARPTVVNNLIMHCKVGIQNKDWADPLILNCDIVDCQKGVDCYRKNWRYGEGGRGRLWNCRIQGNGTALSLDDRSRLVLESCVVEGPLRGATERIALRHCATDPSAPPAPASEAFARFALPSLPAAIGRGELLGLRARPLLIEQRFEDAISPSHLGWELERGRRIYVQDRCLRAGLGERGERLVHEQLGRVGAGRERRLHLDLSAADATSAIIELDGRELARVELDLHARALSIELAPEQAGSLALRTTAETTLRLHSAAVSVAP